MRLDVALFELRLFKSRAQAQAAIGAGHVLVNGAAAKPAREIAAGVQLTITSGERRRTVEVLELPGRSVSRAAAQALVRDVPE